MAFGIILLVLLSVSCSSFDSASGQKKSILQIIVLTENNPTEELLDSRHVTVELAADLINNSSAILSGYEVRLSRRSSGCDDPPGLSPFLAATALLEPPGQECCTIRIIGPTCSNSALLLGLLVGRDSFSSINIHTAWSSRLESHSSYPNSFGIAGSSSLLMRSAIQLIVMKNWKKVSVLYDNSHLYQPSLVRDSTLHTNFTIKEYFVSSHRLAYIPLAEVKLESRIVFLFVGEELARKVLCLAYHTGMVFPAFQFLLAGTAFTSLERAVLFTAWNGNTYSCSSQQLSIALFQAVFINFQTIPKNHSATDYGQYFSSENFIGEFEGRLGKKNRTFQQLGDAALHYFDALWSLALAFHNSQLELGNNQSNSSCDFCSCPKMLRKQILRLNFSGFSGQIHFSNSNGFVGRHVSLYQSTNEGVILLGTHDHKVSMLDTVEEGHFLPWKIPVNDTSIGPSVIPKPLAYICLIVTSAVLLLLVILHALTIFYRNKKGVKASSFKMLHLVYGGSYTLVLCIVAYTSIEGFSKEYGIVTTCYLLHVVNASYTVGFTLIVSTLCLRTWRLYRIFVFYKNPGRFLANRTLIAAVFACVAVDAFVILMWVIVDPFKPTLLHLTSEVNILRGSNGSVTGVENLQLKFISCRVGFSLIFWLLSLNSLNIILSITLFVLTILARKIPQKCFKTQGSGVIRLNYVTFCCGYLTQAIYLLLVYRPSSDSVVIRFILFTLLLNVFNILACAFLYCPPLYSIFSSKHK